MDATSKKYARNPYKQVRYDNGLCMACGQPRDTERTLCATCREQSGRRSKVRLIERKAKRLCTRCGTTIESTVVGLKCLKCWFQSIAIIALNDWTKGEAIATLFFAQHGKCAYSDETLIPGDNACIDHKTPRTRGGSNELDNIHWVTKDINRIKGTMTHEEFVSLSKRIAQKYS
jgi:5-methylcytosine-specific restriction endonuclease McrA